MRPYPPAAVPSDYPKATVPSTSNRTPTRIISNNAKSENKKESNKEGSELLAHGKKDEKSTSPTERQAKQITNPQRPRNNLNATNQSIEPPANEIPNDNRIIKLLQDQAKQTPTPKKPKTTKE